MAQLTFPTAPGVTVNITAASGGSGTPAPNAQAFVVGLADRGLTTYTRVLDFLDFQTKFGSRNAAAAILSDSVETLFGEGGYDVFVARVVGVTPTKGTLALMDRNGSPVLTATATAAWYGSQSANLSIGIVAGTVANSFDLLVFDTAAAIPTNPVETWRDNTSVANMVAAVNAGSSYLTMVDNASSSSGTAAFPALAAGVGTALSAGTDDRTTANDTTWGNALAAFPNDLGGGLLLAPGRYTSSFHLIMETAAAGARRTALLDGPPNPAAADLTSLALADSVGSGVIDTGDVGMGFSPWGTIPPAPGGSVVRQVPMSAAVAGLIAKTDAKAGHSNQAPMGIFGQLVYVTGIVGPGLVGVDRSAANGRQGTTGWNVVRQRPGAAPQVFGFRTVSAAARSYFGANVRETLGLRNDIERIGDTYIGAMIDGQGTVFMDLANDISARLRTSYDLDALYGATSDLAYGVDVGPTVNTPQSIAAGIIRARVWFIPSPTAERVIIDLVRTPVPTS